MPDGTLSVIVDIGAWTNLCGRKLARAIAAKAIAAGYQPEQWKMQTPLTIMGVGNGTQGCTWETRLPYPIDDGEDVDLHHFETPTVEGTGEDLPGLLGLRSIRSKEGVVETGPGKEMLSFPGPGGYEIKWSPGTKHVPLRNAPSGHLVMPLADFSKIKNKHGGIKNEGTVFHAVEPSTSGLQSMPQSTSHSSSSTHWEANASHAAAANTNGIQNMTSSSSGANTNVAAASTSQSN